MSQLGADGGAIGGAALIYQKLFQVPRSHEDGSPPGRPAMIRKITNLGALP
jgi:hypothetical protein